MSRITPPSGLDATLQDDESVPLLTEEVALPPGVRPPLPGSTEDIDWVDLADRLRVAVLAELNEEVARMLSARMAESVRAAIGPAISQASAALQADLEVRVGEAVDRAVSAEIQRLRSPR